MGVNIEDASEYFPFSFSFFERCQRRQAVGWIEFAVQFSDAQVRAVVQADVADFAFFNFYRNILKKWNEIQLVECGFVFLHVAIALGRTFMVVEGHARRDHVNHGESAMCDGGFYDRLKLLLVAAERTRYESRAPFEGQ